MIQRCTTSLTLIMRLLLCVFLVGSIMLTTSIKAYADEDEDFADQDLGEQINTVMETIADVTCETQVALHLLRGELTHTCMKSSFASLTVANIISPLLYAMTMLKLRIDDDKLFGDQDCNYKTPYDNPKLSFAFCSNLKMGAIRIKALGIGVYVIADAILSGGNVWDSLKGVFSDDPEDYHEVFMDKPVGESGTFIDVTGAFPWKVVKDRDTICLATQSFGGWMPVGCKFIAEPFPASRYKSFFTGESLRANAGDVVSADPGDANPDEDSIGLMECSHLGPCYKRARDNSKAVVSISLPIVECVRDALVKLLVSKTVCSFQEAQNRNVDKTESVFYKFQTNMHRIVSALLTMYIVFFGFSIVLGANMVPKGQIVSFVLKFVLVTYFSIGISAGDEYGPNFNGMIDWIFPLIFGASAQLADMVVGTGGINGVCEFHAGDYQSGFGHIALWDAIDCRLGHYLGIDVIADIAANGTGGHFSIPPYFILLIPAVIMGNIMLIIIIIMYPILIIAVSAYLVNSFCVGLITVTILGVLSPVFVPFALFNHTKPYFDSWAKQMMSFTIQPMVVSVFLMTMFSVYDMGFFGRCKYEPQATTIDHRERIYYSLDTDESHYSREEFTSCTRSLGWILSIITNGNIDAAVTIVKGLFTDSVEATFNKILNFIYSMLTACLIMYLMYVMTGNLVDFVSDLSLGMSLSAVTVSPAKMVSKMKGAVEAAIKAQSGGVGGSSGGDGDDSEGDGKSSDRSDANSSDHMSDDSSSSDHMSGGEGERQGIGDSEGSSSSSSSSSEGSSEGSSSSSSSEGSGEGSSSSSSPSSEGSAEGSSSSSSASSEGSGEGSSSSSSGRSGEGDA